MNSARLDQLKQFTEEDPHDPFNWYALALEYLGNQPSKALEIFEKLLKEHKDYIPTYYHTGKLLVTLGHQEKAISVLQQGINLAKDKQDYKTLRELQAFLDEILYE